MEYQRTLRQRIISAIADPNIALILLVIGALGIYVEFSSPGLIAPGVFGGILVLLGLSAISVLPINWLGAALLLLAFTLFVLEVKFTSHGVLGVGGAMAMVLGAVMLVDSPVPEMRIHWSTAIALALPFSAITVFLLTLAVRARRNKVETGSRRHDRADRRGVDRTGARGQGVRPRRVLGRGRGAPGGRRGAREGNGHRPAEADGGTCGIKETTMNDLSPVLLIFVIIVGNLAAELHQDSARVRTRRDLPAGAPAAASPKGPG